MDCSPSMAPDNDDRPIFYYLKNQQNKKVATICLIRFNEWFSRGISICSLSDQFNKSDGKWWANERATIGITILKNSAKPLTEKQIRRGRTRARFIDLDKIKRADAIEIAKSIVYINPATKEITTQELPSMHKISTCDESGLTEFEKRLMDKIKR